MSDSPGRQRRIIRSPRNRNTELETARRRRAGFPRFLLGFERFQGVARRKISLPELQPCHSRGSSTGVARGQPRVCVPHLVGSRLPSPYHSRARIQSFQGVAAPFPGDSVLPAASRAATPATAAWELRNFSQQYLRFSQDLSRMFVWFQLVIGDCKDCKLTARKIAILQHLSTEPAARKPAPSRPRPTGRKNSNCTVAQIMVIRK